MTKYLILDRGEFYAIITGENKLRSFLEELGGTQGFKIFEVKREVKPEFRKVVTF